jgi:hypothetical protein
MLGARELPVDDWAARLFFHLRSSASSADNAFVDPERRRSADGGF